MQGGHICVITGNLSAPCDKPRRSTFLDVSYPVAIHAYPAFHDLLGLPQPRETEKERTRYHPVGGSLGYEGSPFGGKLYIRRIFWIDLIYNFLHVLQYDSAGVGVKGCRKVDRLGDVGIDGGALNCLASSLRSLATFSITGPFLLRQRLRKTGERTQKADRVSSSSRPPKIK